MKRDKLQAKEQENKKLKEDEKSLLNIIDDLQKEKNKWIEKYNDLGQDFDQLKRKEQECEKYRQALDEIEQTINNFPSREIQEIPQTQVEFTQYLLYVSEAKLRKISGIIYELRRDNNG